MTPAGGGVDPQMAPATRRKRTPVPGDVVRVVWWDIQTHTNTRIEGAGLPSAWSIGLVIEWDAPDPSGLRRTILQHGCFDGENQDSDFSEFPQGTITSWKFYR